MFHKNLKYYRLKKNMSKLDLAKAIGVTPMAITYYESGERRPDMPTIKALASVLGVMVSDFLVARNENLVFQHAEFRKLSNLPKKSQETVFEDIEEYFNRFYTSVEILGGEVLPSPPAVHTIPLTMDIEKDAAALRSYLGLSPNGPLGSLIEVLENHGVLVYQLDSEFDGFRGVNGLVNGRPYVVVNRNMTAERIRTTIGHEIAHFAFDWPSDLSEKSIEKIATAIAGAFLFPRVDAFRELGVHRSSLTTDMFMVCKEYGISMSLLAARAFQIGIISQSIYRGFLVRRGDVKSDTFITKEVTTLFEQLVYRAVNECDISIQKGAELLRLPYETVAINCHGIGE